MPTATPHQQRRRQGAHGLHAGTCVFDESNCYVDLWIELLYALELEPHAMLAHVLEVDFEGDQFTFVKPNFEDLRLLYGIEVQELQIWDRLLRHVADQVRRGRIVLVEVDAYYLPDTAGVTHHESHAKTTIGIDRIELEQHRLGYFHNSGHYELRADDFDAVLEPAGPLPPYAEIVKLERREQRCPAELRRRSWQLLCRNLTRRPRDNPIALYLEAFVEHARWLSKADLPFFHRYAFASMRQCGAAFELAARYLRWLAPDDPFCCASAEDFDAIAVASKALLLKLARSVQTGRAADVTVLASVAPRYDAALERLSQCALEMHGEVA